MARRVRLFGSHGVGSLVVLISLILLILAGTAGPVGAAKKSELPPRIGFYHLFLYPELAEDLGLPKTAGGTVVLWTQEGSPAASSGLKPGDVIVKIQRHKAKPVEVPDAKRFEAALKNLRADQDVTLHVLRGGKETPITLRPSTSPFGPPVQPPANPAPATLKAAATGGGDTRTLVGALLRARPGDTVLVSGKQYATPVWLDNLTLTSLDPASPAEVGGLEVTQAKGVKIRNLTLTPPAGSTSGGYGVDISGSRDVLVENSRIQGFMEGLQVAASEGVVLDGNTVSGNVGGIYVQNSSAVLIRRNFVFRNTLEMKWFNFAGGVCVQNGSAEIIQNTILENQVSPEKFRSSLGAVTGVGVFIIDATAVVANNVVLNNTVGVMVNGKAQATVEYNDVMGHAIQGGTWTRGNNEYHLQAAPANFLTQISYEYKPQPIFPIINFEPDRHYYTPSLQYQPSQTNLSVDPLFADRLKGDYRLAADSPLINRGRGGTYIGAFPPVITVPPVSSGRGAAATPAATAAPAPSGSPSVSSGDATPAGKPAATGGGYRAWIQGNSLFVQAEAVDGLIARLRQRLVDNPGLLERVKGAPLGVPPFALTAAEGLTLSAGLVEDLTTALINSGLNPGDPGLMKKALAELEIKDSGQLDQTLGRELGRKAKCGFLLVGSVSDRGSILVVNVRLLEVESGQYLAAERLELARAAN